MMNLRLSVKKHFNEIMLSGDAYDLRYAISKVPGSRFHKKTKKWFIPYSPISWRRLQDEIISENLPVVIHEVDPSNPVELTLVKWFALIQQAQIWKDESSVSLTKFKTKTKPWDHQQRAYEFLVDLNFNAYLGMKMGTGKTLVALNAVADLRPAKILVLCPKPVISVWKSEALKHLPDNTVDVCALEVGGSIRKAEQLAIQAMHSDLKNKQFMCVVNYESFWRDDVISEIYNHKWDMLICDEAHVLKNHMGVASKAVFRLSKMINHKILLSGTPIPNAIHDVLGQYRIIDIGMFGGTITGFRSEYYEMNQFHVNDPKSKTGKRKVQTVESVKNQDQFNELMNLMTFIVGKEAIPDLPEYTHQKRVVDIGKKSWKNYIELEEEFTTFVNNEEVTAMNVLSKLVKLQQITSGFLPIQKPGGNQVRHKTINDAKQKALKAELDTLRGEKVVVFARFHHDIDVIKKTCRELGLRAAEKSGRRDDMDSDQFPPGYDVLVAQLRSGGTGLNLADSCYAIYWNVWYSLFEYDQSLSRIHRGGQKRKVTYIHLLAKDTIDEVIYQALEDKQEIIDVIINYIKKGGKV